MSDEAAWVAIRREVRILRWVICFMAVVLGALAYQRARPGVLRGTELELVDDRGRMYVQIHRTEKAAKLVLLDGNEKMVVGLVASDDHGGLVGIVNPDGELMAGAGTLSDGAAALLVMGLDGVSVWGKKGPVPPKADPNDAPEPPASQPSSAPTGDRFNLNSKLSAPDPSPSSSPQGAPSHDPNAP